MSLCRTFKNFAQSAIKVQLLLETRIWTKITTFRFKYHFSRTRTELNYSISIQLDIPSTHLHTHNSCVRARDTNELFAVISLRESAKFNPIFRTHCISPTTAECLYQYPASRHQVLVTLFEPSPIRTKVWPQLRCSTKCFSCSKLKLQLLVNTRLSSLPNDGNNYNR